MRPTRGVERHQTGAIESFLANVTRAGLEVPPELQLALAAESVIDAEWQRTRERLSAAATPQLATAMAAKVRAAAATGTIPANFAKRIADAEQDERIMAKALGVLEEARDQAALMVVDILASPDGIITDLLRPRFEALLAEVRRVVPLLEGADADDDRQLLFARDGIQAAGRRLREIHDALQAVFAARNALIRLAGGPPIDGSGQYSMVRHPERLPRGPRPDPARIEFVTWLANTDAEPWLPTVAEQNAAGTEAASDRKSPKNWPTSGVAAGY